MSGLRLHPFLAALALLAACSDTGKDTDGDTTTTTTTSGGTAATTSGGGTETTTGDDTEATASSTAPTGSTTVMPDPDYRRECQAGDFVCDDLGCEEVTIPDECYKRCTPDGEVGGVDSECDEPERPFCSQVGLADGGDFACNACVHICKAESENWCDFAADECQ
ncbi:hypothetical protein [Nannocystis punicea]|uniref:Kazal-type serine protease inhibitor domain-containing protein n=1 Tax=Nannocystis punicea TaxID=2995304 RepID=A0ABY7H8N7_9BACT|nr:hypothetical protein [Nannocystis poenicansa]WAS95617.1 hypothetical protein O0S08_05595 [Nannocystis poenicansa]